MGHSILRKGKDLNLDQKPGHQIKMVFCATFPFKRFSVLNSPQRREECDAFRMIAITFQYRACLGSESLALTAHIPLHLTTSLKLLRQLVGDFVDVKTLARRSAIR